MHIARSSPAFKGLSPSLRIGKLKWQAIGAKGNNNEQVGNKMYRQRLSWFKANLKHRITHISPNGPDASVQRFYFILFFQWRLWRRTLLHCTELYNLKSTRVSWTLFALYSYISDLRSPTTHHTMTTEWLLPFEIGPMVLGVRLLHSATSLGTGGADSLST